jgi:hypothetical protein
MEGLGEAGGDDELRAAATSSWPVVPSTSGAGAEIGGWGGDLEGGDAEACWR